MRRHRNLEEEFAAIAPAGRRGLRPLQTISVGFTNAAGTGGAPSASTSTSGSGNSASASSFSQAAQEIAALEEQFRQQSALIQANTQALQNNTSAHGAGSGGSSVANSVTGFLGGGLGLLSPVVTGLAHLFGLGGGSQTPAPLPYYIAPPSVQLGETVRQTPAQAPAPSASDSSLPAAPAAAPAPAAPSITVNVSAMDSQSFLDRSNDIASAVREAMLNLHPINDVIANL